MAPIFLVSVGFLGGILLGSLLISIVEFFLEKKKPR